MNCPKCGRLWDVSNKITSSTYVCPYCGDAVDSLGQSKKDLREIILRIKSDYGEDIIDDAYRLNALLMDYAPEMAKERKLVINAIKEGVLDQLKRGIDEEEDSEVVTRRCVAFLVAEMWVTEMAAQYAVDTISYALGLDLSFSDVNDSLSDNGDSGRQLIKGDTQVGTVMGEGSFQGYDSIGYKAFASNNQLEELVIPDNIKVIYPKAFIDCVSLRTVKLGRNIQIIGKAAFDGCINIEQLIIDNNQNYTASKGMLIDKNNRRLIRSVNSSETEIFIANGVKTVCKKAFEQSKVETINVPGTVEAIEEDAFYLTLRLKEIRVDPKNKLFRSVDGVLHTRDGKTLLRYPQGKGDAAYYLEDSVTVIGRKAFSCSATLSSITFAGGLKEIGENAFEYCLRMENLMLPRSVVSIGERAFQYCENLISIMLPQGIIRIGDCAFMGCRLLKTVSIPRSVTEIGNMAFAGCTSLSKVVIQDNVKYIGDKAFGDCPEIEISIKGNDYVETYCRMHGIRSSKF